ncbi:MAG: orotidine-5'-phosphate decarboxylase [Candidatus Thermoplasmatota archaeon]|nr:orotidine-5'-phosphate decarboxylase [Candidatus Thermoplasmatota archaeon]
MMKPEEVWGPRWVNSAHPISHEYMRISSEKNSLVVLAADLPSVGGIIDLIESVGSKVCALKTHVDMVDDFSMDSWKNLVEVAKSNDVLLFEDRKFADIGSVAQTQMGGLYNIQSWADVVTCHSVSGPDVVDGIAAGWEEAERVGGVLLLAQMSSSGNLLDDSYGDRTLEIGNVSPHVMGYIGNGSSPIELKRLRSKVGEGRMIWTPGVSLSAKEGVLGQRYGNPAEAVISGSDAIIVGSGIHGSEDAFSAAQDYASASWNALLER